MNAYSVVFFSCGIVANLSGEKDKARITGVLRGAVQKGNYRIKISYVQDNSSPISAVVTSFVSDLDIARKNLKPNKEKKMLRQRFVDSPIPALKQWECRQARSRSE